MAKHNWWLGVLGMLAVAVIVTGVLFYAHGANEGDKGSDLGAGLITGGVIAIIVFGAEMIREGRANAMARQESLRRIDAPLQDFIPQQRPSDDSGTETL